MRPFEVPNVKYKYTSSVSTSFAPLKLFLYVVKSTKRMTVSELHAVLEGFPSLSQQKKQVKCLQTVLRLPQQQVAISIKAWRLDAVSIKP